MSIFYNIRPVAIKNYLSIYKKKIHFSCYYLEGEDAALRTTFWWSLAILTGAAGVNWSASYKAAGTPIRADKAAPWTHFQD